MQNIATIAKGGTHEQDNAAGDDFSVRNPLARFRLFIETTDWDKGHLLNEEIDNLCLYLLVAASLCFLASIALIFMK